MFTKKHTPTYEAVASDMKALGGRHARLDGNAFSSNRCAARAVGTALFGMNRAEKFQMVCGAGAYAAFDTRNEAFALQDLDVTYRAASAPKACRFVDRAVDDRSPSCQAGNVQGDAEQARSFGDAPASFSNEGQQTISAAELEQKFQDFFRMGAVVAIGELFDEGMLGDKDAVADDVCDYLDSFGVTGLDDIRALGISGPYLEDFERMYAAPASFPPAA